MFQQIQRLRYGSRLVGMIIIASPFLILWEKKMLIT